MHIATVRGATPALLEQRDQVCGTRPEHEAAGLIAQRCKQARLPLEATQAAMANQHDASMPQHQSKVASSCFPEQHTEGWPAPLRFEDSTFLKIKIKRKQY